MFKPVDPKVNFPKLEEEILEYWKKNKIFEKSVESRPENKKWTFLDGPPFVTGMPHYGHMLGSIHKDLFGRYWTMKGYRVRRVWGWDGHGLPIENKVEGKLGIKSKKEIVEKVGVDKFIEECRKYVEKISGEWEWYIDHIGRWVDFKNAYKTWETDYMESVMWVFKQMYEGGHVYKGLKVTLYCPHCATPISNFEVAMDTDNYKEVDDYATVYKYKLKGEDDTFILAWSTTPWNKIVTTALAVNPKLTYVKVRQGDEFYILAQSGLKMLNGKHDMVKELKGSELIGRRFEGHYDYFPVEPEKKLFEIIGDDFVTAEEGTGVVTIAAYGEEDLKVMREQNIHIEIHLDEEGKVLPNVPKFGGMYYLKANKAVNEDLSSRNLIYSDKQENHSIPLCWRCHTRLYYSPINAWYVDVQKLKPLLIKTNEEVNWFPKHFKHGRFIKSLENAPDWNISRNRYWGSPVPVWECDCGESFVPGSIKELEEESGEKIKDLHKPHVDEIKVVCRKCGKKATRVPEVLDSWIEAGSASFAERHFPFSKEEKLEDFFPPDFIAEYTGQIRAWFYVLHVIGGALYKTKSFKNVGVEGVILGSDGRKMSKNLGNYPDPKELLGKYGGDALRLYLMGSSIMRGEDIIISEEQYRNQLKGLMLTSWNVYNFFVTYATLDKWQWKEDSKSENVLDNWIMSLLQSLISDITADLDGYDTVSAISRLNKFMADMSNWYIRRSRDRIGLFAEDKKDKEAFFSTSYKVLTSFSQILAPIAPFISEEIYRNLTGEESVHLSEWPKKNGDNINIELEQEMGEARLVVEEIHSQRKKAGIKLRQPLGSVNIQNLKVEIGPKVSNVIRSEVNIKEAILKTGKGDMKVELDINISPVLKKEGQARDIIRKIQEERKLIGTHLDEVVDVTISEWPNEFEDYIKNKALVRKLVKGKDFAVKRADEQTIL